MSAATRKNAILVELKAIASKRISQGAAKLCRKKLAQPEVIGLNFNSLIYG